MKSKTYKPNILWRLVFNLCVYFSQRSGYDLIEWGPVSRKQEEWLESQGYSVWEHEGFSADCRIYTGRVKKAEFNPGLLWKVFFYIRALFTAISGCDAFLMYNLSDKRADWIASKGFGVDECEEAWPNSRITI